MYHALRKYSLRLSKNPFLNHNFIAMVRQKMLEKRKEVKSFDFIIPHLKLNEARLNENIVREFKKFQRKTTSRKVLKVFLYDEKATPNLFFDNYGRNSC